MGDKTGIGVEMGAEMGAKTIAALIDGLYIQTALNKEVVNTASAQEIIHQQLDNMLGASS